MRKKGQLVQGELVYWLIALGLLVVSLTIYFILRAKGISLTEYMRDLLRFGR